MRVRVGWLVIVLMNVSDGRVEMGLRRSWGALIVSGFVGQG